MTVAKAIKILKTMPQNAEIYYFDTWWESEGWGENADESAWNSVDNIEYNAEDNTIKLI